MSKTSRSSQQTAYSKQRRARSNPTAGLDGWDPVIAQLLNLGHNFLACEYSEPGWLYRGATQGLEQILRSGELGHFNGEQSVNKLERELGVYLLSQDLSDAYAAARFWENPVGAYIAVFKSSVFNRELHAGRAAVLGFAEPGVVFKYPFLTRPLPIIDLDLLIVGAQDFALLQNSALQRDEQGFSHRLVNRLVKTPEIDPDNENDRKEYEQALLGLLQKQQIRSAKAVVSKQVPTTPG